jgi:hypothetical protein
LVRDFPVRGTWECEVAQMPNKRPAKTQRKAFRIFVKPAYMVCAIIAALCGVSHFRNSLPTLIFLSADSHGSERDLPNGSILIPQEDGVCRLREIDTETSQIHDGGLVNCLDAAAQNTESWKWVTNAQKANEIRRSFHGG